MRLLLLMLLFTPTILWAEAPRAFFDQGQRQAFLIEQQGPLQTFARPGKPLASSSPQSWVTLNQDRQLSQLDLMQPFAVLIAGELGQGRFAVFADDATFQKRFLSGGNRQLAKNLAAWLLDSQAIRLKC